MSITANRLIIILALSMLKDVSVTPVITEITMVSAWPNQTADVTMIVD